MTQDDEILVGRPVGARDEFLIKFGLDSFKQSVPVLNDVLSKFLALNTAVFGAGLAGSVGFKDSVPVWGALAALSLVLGSIAAVLVGMYPREHDLNVLDADAVYDTEVAVMRFKANCLKAASALLVAALATAIGCVAWPRL